MAEAVYVLCALTSTACAAMLLRGYFKSKARFLLWSSLCFVALALNNLFLFVDNVLYSDGVALVGATWRSLIALVGLALLLYGLIWDAE